MMPAPVNTVDVVILGGGIVGSSAAAHLASHEISVLLLDEVSQDAPSRRAAAFVAHPYDDVQLEIFERSVELMHELDPNMPSTPAGMMLLAREQDLAARVTEEMADLYPELEPQLIPPDELGSLEPSVACGLWACRLKTGFPICPRVATEQWSELAVRRGAILRKVKGAGLLWEKSRCVGLMWDEGRVHADRVVVAAGAASVEIVEPGGRWRPVRPLWGIDVEVRMHPAPAHVLLEATLARAQAGTMPRMDYGFSLVTAERRSALGSTFLASAPQPGDWPTRLMDHGSSFVPALSRATAVRVRACARPESRDGRPLLGYVRGAESLLIATGTGGRGISTGPACGQLVAEAALNDSEEHIPARMRASRFPLE